MLTQEQILKSIMINKHLVNVKINCKHICTNKKHRYSQSLYINVPTAII